MIPNQETSDPEIYESPRMFRHGEDLYLIGKADPDEIGEFIMGL